MQTEPNWVPTKQNIQRGKIRRFFAVRVLAAFFWIAIPCGSVHVSRPVFTHGPPGPGPRAANFQGRHIKKFEIEVWYAGEKKGSPRERNLREIYTENNVGTEFSRYDATGARRS